MPPAAQAVFPVGKLAQLKGSTRDIEFMEALLKEVRSNKVGTFGQSRWGMVMGLNKEAWV